MEYINKNILEKEGEIIIYDYLHRLKANGSNYPKDLYLAFNSDKDDNGKMSRDKLIEVLLLEQDDYCCYCMRHLDSNDTITLEHLILNKIDEKAFQTYFKRDTVLKNKVCFAANFISKEETQTPPYPHTVAYQNLVASCNGQIIPGSKNIYCCNLKRKSKNIEPIVLYDTINKEVTYHQNGRAVWEKEQDEIPTLNKLGLNDAILRMIRRIWIYIKNEGIDLDHIERKTFLYDLLSKFSDKDFNDMNEFNMLFNFQKDLYWDLIKKYSYFGK